MGFYFGQSLNPVIHEKIHGLQISSCCSCFILVSVETKFEVDTTSIILRILTRNNSLEIWAVKLRFLLIFEIMLKRIATARSECTVKQENKASYNTYYILPDLIDFFGDDWKEIKTQTEKINIHNCKKYCTD